MTLIEVLIVILILSILASVALPTVTKVRGRASLTALDQDTLRIRGAITRYAAEHDGPPDADSITLQLTTFTDKAGNASPNRTATHVFGPYLNEVAALAIGQQQGQAGILSQPAGHAAITSIAPGLPFGWCYHGATGYIHPLVSETEVGPEGEPLNHYDPDSGN